MKKSKAIGISFLWILLFFAVQIIISIAASVGTMLGDIGSITESVSASLPVTLILSNIITSFFVIAVQKLNGENLGSTLGLRRTKLTNIITALFFASALAPVISWILGEIQIPDALIENYNALMEQTLGDDNMLTNISVIFLAPLCEELVFRGAILNTLKKSFSVPVAALISSLLFGFAHLNIIQSSYAFVLGLVLCFICIRFNSLWTSVAAHMSFNIIGGYFDISALEQTKEIALLSACAVAAILTGIWMAATMKRKKT